MFPGWGLARVWAIYVWGSVSLRYTNTHLHPPANQDYYQQWSLEEGEPCAMDMSTYTLEELEHITSEYTLRNQVCCGLAFPAPCMPFLSHSS